jgi:hypothetical protein
MDFVLINVSLHTLRIIHICFDEVFAIAGGERIQNQHLAIADRRFADILLQHVINASIFRVIDKDSAKGCLQIGERQWLNAD